MCLFVKAFVYLILVEGSTLSRVRRFRANSFAAGAVGGFMSSNKSHHTDELLSLLAEEGEEAFRQYWNDQVEGSAVRQVWKDLVRTRDEEVYEPLLGVLVAAGLSPDSLELTWQDSQSGWSRVYGSIHDSCTPDYRFPVVDLRLAPGQYPWALEILGLGSVAEPGVEVGAIIISGFDDPEDVALGDAERGYPRKAFLELESRGGGGYQLPALKLLADITLGQLAEPEDFTVILATITLEQGLALLERCWFE